MLKTSNTKFRIRSKTFFIVYKTKNIIDLQTVKSYLFSAFLVSSENELKFFLININTQKTNTIIVLLEFNKTQEIRNSGNQAKLSLHINNQLIEGTYFPINGSYLAMLYILQFNVSNNKNYITNFDKNLIEEISQHLISLNLNNKPELNVIKTYNNLRKTINSKNTNVSETNGSLTKNNKQKKLTEKNIVTLRDSIPKLLNAMIRKENSRTTNPLRAKIDPQNKLANYKLTSQQKDILSWCISAEYKKRIKNGQKIPKEYLNINYEIFPKKKEF